MGTNKFRLPLLSQMTKSIGQGATLLRILVDRFTGSVNKVNFFPMLKFDFYLNHVQDVLKKRNETKKYKLSSVDNDCIP